MPIVRLAAASLAAAFCLAGASASAADLSGEYYERHSGSPYDDPRYGDIYRDPPPPPRPYRDDYDADDDGPPPVHRYSEVPPPHVRDPGCVPRREIHFRLRADGWSDFEDLELRGDIALVRARRPSGEPYELSVDRCTGDIVHARPLHGPVWGPYAYRWRRPWYRY